MAKRRSRWSSWIGLGVRGETPRSSAPPSDTGEERRGAPKGRRASDKPGVSARRPDGRPRGPDAEDTGVQHLDAVATRFVASSTTYRETYPEHGVDGDSDAEEFDEPPTLTDLLVELDRIAEFQFIVSSLIRESMLLVQRGRIERARYAIPEAVVDRLRLRLQRTRAQRSEPAPYEPEK